MWKSRPRNDSLERMGNILAMPLPCTKLIIHTGEYKVIFTNQDVCCLIFDYDD